jgi:2-amino-4-hydroxy-6-hydroxymethyldihydropteridine diphosphokinase
MWESSLSVASVYLGLGSNIAPEENLRLGIRELQHHYGALTISNVYRSKSVGFDGPDFLNAVVGFESGDSPASINELIESIHDKAGRCRGSDRYSSRPLDIDLLLYDDRVIDDGRLHLPRADVLEYGFVLGPLAEIAPDLVHPETGVSIAAHWAEFDKTQNPLTRVDGIL